MKTYLIIMTIFYLSSALAQTRKNQQTPEAKVVPLKYSEVKIYVTDTDKAATLQRAGLALDHFHYEGNFMGVILNNYELESLKTSGIKYEVIINDVVEAYRQRPRLSPEETEELQEEMRQRYAMSGFGFGSMGGYYTFSEIVAELDNMKFNFPSLITFRESIGTSIEGNDIWMVKISDNPTMDEAETEILYTALHHAREPQSMATVLYFMYYLLENYGSDPDVTYLVDNRELYFIPVINPDGYLFNEQTNPDGGGLWRKNLRDNNGDGQFNENDDGVDLNRNYGYQWGYDDIGSSPNKRSSTYRGTAAFSEPEIQAIRDFCNNHDFEIALNYHSYGNELRYPWGYYNELTPYPDADIFIDLAECMTQFNEYEHGNPAQLGGVVNVKADDWMYGEQTDKNKIYAMTPEVGSRFDDPEIGYYQGFWPSIERIFPLCEENVYPNLVAAYGGITNLQNITVGVPETRSWMSARSITAAGEGTFFNIQGNNLTGGEVTFTAGAIYLRPGFYARENSHFLATIDPGMGICGEGSPVIASSPAKGNIQTSEKVRPLKVKSDSLAQGTGISKQSGQLAALPEEFALFANYPNPFNPATTIKYALKADVKVSLKIYNMLGQEVRTLIDEPQPAGFREVFWNAKNNFGQQVASGIYIYRIVAGNYIQTHRMILLK
jgi:hypothetical protein